jgi:hypothetical protein
MPRPCPSYWRTLRADGFRRRSLVRPPVQTTKPPAVERTDGFALSPYVPFSWMASLGCRNRAVKFAAAFTCVPPFRSKKRGTPIRPRKPTTPRRSPPLFIEHNASLAYAPKKEIASLRQTANRQWPCLGDVDMGAVYFLVSVVTTGSTCHGWPGQHAKGAHGASSFAPGHMKRLHMQSAHAFAPGHMKR